MLNGYEKDQFRRNIFAHNKEIGFPLHYEEFCCCSILKKKNNLSSGSGKTADQNWRLHERLWLYIADRQTLSNYIYRYLIVCYFVLNQRQFTLKRQAFPFDPEKKKEKRGTARGLPDLTILAFLYIFSQLTEGTYVCQQAPDNLAV